MGKFPEADAFLAKIMICRKCKSRNKVGSDHCRKCGYKFAGGTYVPVTPTMKIAQRAIDRTTEQIRK